MAYSNIRIGFRSQIRKFHGHRYQTICIWSSTVNVIPWRGEKNCVHQEHLLIQCCKKYIFSTAARLYDRLRTIRVLTVGKHRFSNNGRWIPAIEFYHLPKTYISAIFENTIFCGVIDGLAFLPPDKGGRIRPCLHVQFYLVSSIFFSFSWRFRKISFTACAMFIQPH